MYQIGLEDGGNLIAKFYRPERWTDEAILEEHAFCNTLVEYDLPVIAPITSENGESLLHAGPFRFCLFEKAGGRPPEMDNSDQLAVIGRTLARLHSVGEQGQFQHRPTINAKRLGDQSINLLRETGLVPTESQGNYFSLVDDIMPIVHERFASIGKYTPIRIHGDFHPGNILWGREDTPHILDLDDTGTGPSVQDLWMFISGDRQYAQARLGDILDGYFEFREFDERELTLIEPLRALRIIHYAAWIAKRWEDPAFKQAFPFFAEARFWDEHVLSLREQFAALNEEPLIY